MKIFCDVCIQKCKLWNKISEKCLLNNKNYIEVNKGMLFPLTNFLLFRLPTNGLLPKIVNINVGILLVIPKWKFPEKRK